MFLFCDEECAGAPNCNLNGTKLETCSKAPLTGFNRSGSCEYLEGDRGRHLVCAEVTNEF